MAVYFIQAGEGGPVKIGTGDDPLRRLRTFQAAHWMPLKLIRSIAGGHVIERWLHAHYSALRLRAEWFRFCPTMLSIAPGAVADVHPITDYRVRHGLSMGGMAAELGISRSTLRDIEFHGVVPTSRRTIDQLFGIAGITLEALATAAAKRAA